jgi:hypothetical protein
MTRQDEGEPAAVLAAPEPEPLTEAPVDDAKPKRRAAAPDMLWRDHESRLQAIEKREPPPPAALPAAPGPQERPRERLLPDFVYDLIGE